jgi:pyruvate formate lyase activating enzyme
MFDALKLTGKAMTPDEVLALVRRDKLFYDNSGGGLTASGGEPLLYPDFCAELFAGARAEGIHTALDTAANVPWEHFAAVLPYTIAVLLDLKIMDEKLHTAYTGSSNGLILENARRLFTADIDLYVRIPVIAGVNDSPENAKAAADFLRQAGNLREVSLLPYHGMGVDKARSIGLEQESFSPPGDDVLPALRAFFPCQAAEKMGRTAL